MMTDGCSKSQEVVMAMADGEVADVETEAPVAGVQVVGKYITHVAK
jgi:hypothetical protein